MTTCTKTLCYQCLARTQQEPPETRQTTQQISYISHIHITEIVIFPGQ